MEFLKKIFDLNPEETKRRHEREAAKKKKMDAWGERQKKADKAVRNLRYKLMDAEDEYREKSAAGDRMGIIKALRKLDRLKREYEDVMEQVRDAETINGPRLTIVESLKKFLTPEIVNDFNRAKKGQKLQDDLDDLKRRAGW